MALKGDTRGPGTRVRYETMFEKKNNLQFYEALSESLPLEYQDFYAFSDFYEEDAWDESELRAQPDFAQ